MRYLWSLAFLFSFISCSGIKLINGTNKADLYTPKFLEQIETIKKEFNSGTQKIALNKLNQIPDNQLLPTEKAMKYNLLGVFHFKEDNFENAIYNFDLALLTSALDESLSAQINLNMASSYYKLGMLEKASASLGLIDYRHLTDEEAEKFFYLSYVISEKLENKKGTLRSLIYYLGYKKSLDQLRQAPLTGKMTALFSELGSSEKVRLLEDFSEAAPISAAFLGQREVERLYFAGKRDLSNDLINWLNEHFSTRPEVLKKVNSFKNKTQHYTKVSPSSIGVILPLSGREQVFGERALKGIDFSYKNFAHQQSEQRPVLHIQDSQGNPIVGASAVRELVENKNVSVIIGGLTPEEALREYTEARKYGVFFVSLYPIHLQREQKGSLLLEVPGSIQSQVARLASSDILESLGRKVAVFYPRSKRGEAYAEELWRFSQQSALEVVRVQSYDKNSTDFREPVKGMLSMRYPRLRTEEKELLEQIHELESYKGVRRIQTLQPHIDFDWVFLPGSPTEAVQIVPSFAYYDAFNLKFMGTPSWRSKRMSKSGKKLKGLYFVGDEVKKFDARFEEDFRKTYNKAPRLIELLSFDGMKIVLDLLKGSTFETRAELESILREKRSITGVSGNWFKDKDLWIKRMNVMELDKGNVERYLGPQAIAN